MLGLIGARATACRAVCRRPHRLESPYVTTRQTRDLVFEDDGYELAVFHFGIGDRAGASRTTRSLSASGRPDIPDLRVKLDELRAGGSPDCIRSSASTRATRERLQNVAPRRQASRWRPARCDTQSCPSRAFVLPRSRCRRRVELLQSESDPCIATSSCVRAQRLACCDRACPIQRSLLPERHCDRGEHE